MTIFLVQILGSMLLFSSFVQLTVAQIDACNLCLLLCEPEPVEPVPKEKEGHLDLPFDLGTIVEGLLVYKARQKKEQDDNYGVENYDGKGQSSYQNPYDETKTCSYTTDDATNLITAVEKIVAYYENHYEKISMRSDGGIGLAILAGQLRYLLKNPPHKFTPDFKKKLKKLKNLSSELATKITKQSIAAGKIESMRLGAELLRNHSYILGAQEEWKDPDAITHHFSEFTKIGHEKEVVYPYLDFHCLVALVKNCGVPHVCQKLYLTDIYSQYMLMHQVIYQQFADKRSCPEQKEDEFGDFENFRDRLCSKAYMEAEFLQSHGYPTRFIDLFAEQVGFCGLLGYPNFLKPEWLREILSWQDGYHSGCFPDHYGEKKTTDATIYVDVEIDGEVKQEGCLVHLTSVSLMALSLNLRYMIDTCSPDIFY